MTGASYEHITMHVPVRLALKNRYQMRKGPVPALLYPRRPYLDWGSSK